MHRSLHSSRLVVAGISGDAGKSIVSMALLRALRGPEHAGGSACELRAFKKGPDYIDAAWLAHVSGAPAHNLDTWLMGFPGAVASFQKHAAVNGFNLIEGNRGLFDGVDAAGSHSTAELAKALRAPVLLVVNATKMTRTAAALVLGCCRLDPELRIGGVVLNCVNGKRHERVLRESIESACGIPVVGAVPRMNGDALPERHLGLVTPEDHPSLSILPAALDEVAAHLDLDRIREIAASTEELPAPARENAPVAMTQETVKIAVVRDAAFSFYYEDNLEALEQLGAELLWVSALHAPELPAEADAVYIGGGFPEVHAAALEANASFRRSVAAAAASGLPIYAECGGLMLLSRALRWKDRRYAMAGVLPFEVEVGSAPQGHGYVDMTVDAPNPFYAEGTRLRGHEFHYSRLALPTPKETGSARMALGAAGTVCGLSRGTGLADKRDGAVLGNVWASYTHLHAAASPEWAAGVVRLARQYTRQPRATVVGF